MMEASMGEKYYLIDRQLLSDFGTAIFTAYGLREDDSRILTDALIRSDMRGVKSHGLVRVPPYVEWLTNGTWAKKTEMDIVKDTLTTTVIDGRNGIGSVLSYRACEITKEKARKSGLAFTTVRNSNHLGEAGLWSLQINSGTNDMIGFAVTSTVAICSAPNGMGAGIGSNPFSYAIPAGRFAPVCLDIAVGTMAAGKIWEYKRLNKPFPEKAWIGPDGEFVTDPNKYDTSEFVMVPFGMHKGYGLGVVMEAITSFLAGSTFCRNEYPPGDKWPGSNHAFMAIDINAFTDVAAFNREMEEYIEYLHALPVHKDAPGVLYPGEIEAGKEAKALVEGVKLPAQVFEDMAAIAKAEGVDSAQYRRYTELFV
jgi:Malate/L-lactate dehydrogenases